MRDTLSIAIYAVLFLLGAAIYNPEEAGEVVGKFLQGIEAGRSALRDGGEK